MMSYSSEAIIAKDMLERIKGLEIKIDPAKCTGCKTCFEVCVFKGREIIDGKATIMEHCLGCGRCVDVCPNRANIAIPCNHSANFNDPFEIVHIEAYCNECGNCETFCPYQGAPYKDKLTLFNLKEDFQNSKNSGFIVEDHSVLLRLGGITYNLELAADNTFCNIDSKDTAVVNASSLIEIIIQGHSYLLGPVNK